jgi:chromosome segregation ATPase
MGKRKAKRVSETLGAVTSPAVSLSTEALIRTKIAELEQTPRGSYEDVLQLDDGRMMEEIEAHYFDSELCHEFDSEIINERKSPEERIGRVRELFYAKVAGAKELTVECSALEHRARSFAKQSSKLNKKLGAYSKDMKGMLDMRDKLEEICRLLRKQNKEIGDEMERLTKAEHVRMDEMSQRFAKTIDDITSKLEEQQTEQASQSQENHELRSKLEQFQQHFDLREQHFATQLQTKTLEVQLMEAKHTQHSKVLAQEKAKGDAYKAHISQLIATETELNSQLALYAEKFEHFQEALCRSNSMFTQFKEKTDKMSETIDKLTEDSMKLKGECNKCDIVLIQVLEEKQKYSKLLIEVRSAPSYWLWAPQP